MSVSTYIPDYELFERLNLNKFKDVEHWKQIKIGKCEVSNCEVEIHVEGAPAQFWTIYITFSMGEKKKISTGSGALSDYWKSIEDICSGRLTIENL